MKAISIRMASPVFQVIDGRPQFSHDVKMIAETVQTHQFLVGNRQVTRVLVNGRVVSEKSMPINV